MPNPPTSSSSRSARDTRRRIAYVVVGALLAVIFIGGYVFGILRNMR